MPVDPKELREAIERAERSLRFSVSPSHEGAPWPASPKDVRAADTLRAFLDSGLEVPHDPGDLIAKVVCPCCGAGLEIMHGDDEEEIGVLGSGGDSSLTDSERETVGKVARLLRSGCRFGEHATMAGPVPDRQPDCFCYLAAALAPIAEGK